MLNEIRERVPDISVPIEASVDLTLKRLKELNKKLVLLLDEFEELHSFPPPFFSRLRSMWDDGVCIITATRVPLHECCPSQESSPFHNLRRDVFLGSFTSKEFDEFINNMSSRCQFPDDDFRLSNYKDEIIDLGGRFPFFVQQAAYLFWKAGQEGRHRHLTRGQLCYEIKIEFAHAFQRDFEFILDNLSADEQKIILDLARGKPVPDSLRARVALRSLDYKGYILDHSRVFSSVFRDFIERPEGEKPVLKKLEVNEVNKMVRVGGRIVDFTPLEDKLFWHLYRNRGRTCTYLELWEKVWEGKGTPTKYEMIHAAVSRLREKTEDHNENYIKNVRGVGYRFSWPNDDRSIGQPRSKSVR